MISLRFNKRSSSSTDPSWTSSRMIVQHCLMEWRTRFSSEPNVAKDSNCVVVGCILSSSVKRPTICLTFCPASSATRQSLCSSNSWNPNCDAAGPVLFQSSLEELTSICQHPFLLSLWPAPPHPLQSPEFLSQKDLSAKQLVVQVATPGQVAENWGYLQTPMARHLALHGQRPSLQVVPIQVAFRRWRRRVCFPLPFGGIAFLYLLDPRQPLVLLTRPTNVQVISRMKSTMKVVILHRRARRHHFTVVFYMSP